MAYFYNRISCLFAGGAQCGHGGEYVGRHNMIKKILLMAIVLTGLVLSGCIEDGVQIADDNNTANVTNNVTANASEPVESRSVSIPLEKPPFIEDE